MVLSRVRLIRVRLVLVNLNPINDTYIQPSYKTTQLKRSENSPFSRNLVLAQRKRRGQGGVLWTQDHKRSDANYKAWINPIQSNTTHCAKLGLIRVQESYIDTFTTQVTAPRLFGGFSFRGLKKLKGGGFMNPLHSPRKEHSKTEFGKKNSEKEKDKRIRDLPKQIFSPDQLHPMLFIPDSDVLFPYSYSIP